MLLIAGPVLAFGGVYPWAVPMLLALVAALVVIVRPPLPSSDKFLDLSLLAALGVCALYLVPLPRAALELLSSRRLGLWEVFALTPPPAWLPLTLSPRDTMEALAVFGSAVLTFFCCRRILADRGLRRVTAAIVWTGFALSCVALIQRGLSPNLIYGFWRPEDAGATPFGPFVNRNHGAGWLVMAGAACVGCFMAHAWSSSRHSPSRRLSLDGRAAWLGLAAVAMVLAVVWSLSRSAIFAVLVAGAVLSVSALRRGDSLVGGSVAALTAIAGSAVLLWGDLLGALNRFGHGLGQGRFDRPAIWRDTWTMISDSVMVGTGPGTFRTGMLHYQTADHTYIFNQAHNHPLQILAEGGVLLAVPVACAVVALVMSATRRLREDRTRTFWIRAGAAAALAGIGAQSLWDTTLAVPAASQLAAVLAALLLCRPPVISSRVTSSPTAPPPGAPDGARRVQKRQRQRAVAPIRVSHVRGGREEPLPRQLRPAPHPLH